MPKTRVNCPNCRQPILADIEQLFDVGIEPEAKQRLLSGIVNQIKCPNCGYQGNLATPLLYHDPEKELLLTYFPPEIGLQRDDQERMIGGFINQVINHLTQEKRKGYLLRPQTMLTFQGLVERILEGDGITREMIQAQQAKLNLLQRLMSASPDARAEIARNEDQIIDQEFFGLLTRLVETALASGDRNSAQALGDLQKALLPETTYGRKLQEQSREIEAAVASLQEAGENLTREKLLDLVIEAPNDLRLRSLVSLVRPGMDYSFFQMLTDRIEKAPDDVRAKLIQLREGLLELTRQVDQQVEERTIQTRQQLNKLLEAQDIEEATAQILPQIDELFLRELNLAMDSARKRGELDKIPKLQKIISIIQEATAAPPEITFIEELVDAPDEQTRRQLMESKRDQITPEFIDALTNILTQVENNPDQELVGRLKAIHRQALRLSMEMNLNR